MTPLPPVVIHWFRRDLRLHDNRALNAALESGYKVLPLFIFDKEILEDLPEDDARIQFIHSTLALMNAALEKHNASIKILHGHPLSAWKKLIDTFDIKGVYTVKDYEPYAIQRDKDVQVLLKAHGIPLTLVKDQVIFEEHDILKDDGNPYTVYTPYKRKWLSKFETSSTAPYTADCKGRFCQKQWDFPSLDAIGFRQSATYVKPYDLQQISDYTETRDLPAVEGTSLLSPHLRFGTVSVRQIINQLGPRDETFLSELIWREFFMQILFHFPKVVKANFRSKYDGIPWRNNEDEFNAWCIGKTGYPLVDAGMRELNATGYMHNRVRMVTASFLCKHLLIDWRWGEAYFAEKLLDFELASNNGNWQWAAGTGCDAAPYFRVFNPYRQQERFDPDFVYVKKWVPEFGTADYSEAIVEHKMARLRAIEVYKKGIEF